MSIFERLAFAIIRVAATMYSPAVWMSPFALAGNVSAHHATPVFRNARS
jgi:hypothetical protein